MIEIIEIINTISSLVAFFLPGFVWTLVFFENKEIDWIERIALSFGLSVAFVPIATFWIVYIFGIKTNIAVFLAIIIITGIAVCIYKLDIKNKLIQLDIKNKLKMILYQNRI